MLTVGAKVKILGSFLHNLKVFWHFILKNTFLLWVELSFLYKKVISHHLGLKSFIEQKHFSFNHALFSLLKVKN